MAVTGTLEQIRAKVRKITGRPSGNQISDDEIDDYINDFYVYDLPQHISLWNLHSSLSPLFPTTPSLDQILTEGEWLYAVDWNEYTNIKPPCYVGGYEIEYFQDERSFFQYFNVMTVKQTLATGTGIAGPYAGTITNTPILHSSAFISVMDVAGNTLTANVNAAGVITGDVLAGGTINLVTGAVAGLTWTAVIPAGNDITVQSLSYVSGRPQAVLYMNKSLIFYPVPDVAYEFYCEVDYNPESLGAGDQPEIRQWWNFIALGAARKIFLDNLDMESLGKIQPLFDEQKRLILRRTTKQLSTQRVATIFSGYDSVGVFTGFTGNY